MKLFKTFLAGLAFAGAASMAQAAPITFTYSAEDSSIDTSGLTLCITCSVDISLAPSTSFQLNDIGDSFAFDFINLSIYDPGVGGLGGFITGNLVFTAPGTGGSGTGQAFGVGGWAVGFGAGGLEWYQQPTNIVFSDGSEISLAFTDAIDTCGSLFNCTLSATVQATGDLVSRVPEPATLALLGLGLVGAGLARRRKEDALAA